MNTAAYRRPLRPIWANRGSARGAGGQGEAGAGAGEGAGSGAMAVGAGRGAALGLLLGRGGLPGRYRRRPAVGANSTKTGLGTSRGAAVRPRRCASAVVRRTSHRNGLRLVARQGKAHGEFVGGHRQRAGRPAGLPERGPGFGAGRLGFELHGGRRGRRFHEARRVELHPVRQAGACRRGPTAGCNGDYSFHDNTVRSCGPTAALHYTRARRRGACTTMSLRDAPRRRDQPACSPEIVPRA